MLDYLVRSMREEKLAVVLTVRTDDPAYDDVSEYVAELGSLRRATRVDLTRLGPEDVAAQVLELRDAGSTGPADVERITEVSGGVPLLVEELVAAGTHHLDELADRLLGHRLRHLSTTARSVVDAAAVALVELRPTDLATVVDLSPEDFDAGLAAAVLAGVLVRRAGRVEFRHALLREAAVAALPPTRASRMHRAWAERLEHRVRGLPEAVAVAQHWTAGDRPAPALRAWRRAATLAAQISAYPEQMRMLREAAELWPEVPPEERPRGHRPGRHPHRSSGGGDARSRAPGGQPGAAQGGTGGPAGRCPGGAAGVARHPVGPHPLAPGRASHVGAGRRDGRRHPGRSSPAASGPSPACGPPGRACVPPRWTGRIHSPRKRCWWRSPSGTPSCWRRRRR